MMNPKTQTFVASTTIALTTIVSLVLIPMKPDASAIVMGMMAVFIVVWNGMKHLVKRKDQGSDWVNSKVRHEILFAIILASLLMLGSISATLAKELEIFDRDLVKRIVGVNIGLMLVVLGNYMPKKLTGSCTSGCQETDKGRSAQRLMGWTFVLGGILYALAWIAFDLDQAGIAIMFAFPVAIAVVVIARIAYIRLSGAKKTSEQSV